MATPDPFPELSEPPEKPPPACDPAEETITPRKPVPPTWIFAVPWPASICCAIDIAELIGIANACAPEDWSANPDDPEDPAVSIPSTWPELLTSDPPESPGCTSASTPIAPVSCSAAPVMSSLAVTDCWRPVIEPPAAVGVPPVPPALPTATIDSPTVAVEESPIDAVRRPEAPLSCSTATSSALSYPTTRA